MKETKNKKIENGAEWQNQRGKREGMTHGNIEILFDYDTVLCGNFANEPNSSSER